MKEYTFYPGGVCPSKITIQVEDDGTFNEVFFYGGCSGNHKGLNALCKGMKIEDIIPRLKGISCGGRPTSCPDQLARGLEKLLKEINNDNK